MTSSKRAASKDKHVHVLQGSNHMKLYDVPKSSGRGGQCFGTRHDPRLRHQNRKRTPTVGSMLLCWKKPKPNPPCTWLNIIPK